MKGRLQGQGRLLPGRLLQGRLGNAHTHAPPNSRPDRIAGPEMGVRVEVEGLNHTKQSQTTGRL